MVDFIMEASAALPELIEQLEIGTEPTADISLIMARANAFAEGDPNAAVLTDREIGTSGKRGCRTRSRDGSGVTRCVFEGNDGPHSRHY